MPGPQNAAFASLARRTGICEECSLGGTGEVEGAIADFGETGSQQWVTFCAARCVALRALCGCAHNLSFILCVPLAHTHTPTTTQPTIHNSAIAAMTTALP